MKVGYILTTALSIFIVMISTPDALAESVKPLFQKISGQGVHEFVVISPRASSSDYAEAIADVCESRDICFVRFWDDASSMANKLPMTNAQANTMVAHYARNRRSGVDRYICHPFGPKADRCN